MSARVHWCGGSKVTDSRGMTTERLPGWPCCATGRRARAVRASGRQTYEPELVTCRRCQRMMVAAGILERPPFLVIDGGKR